MYVESLYISVELFHNTAIHNTAYSQPIPSYDQIKVKKCCSPNLIGQTMSYNIIKWSSRHHSKQYFRQF